YSHVTDPRLSVRSPTALLLPLAPLFFFSLLPPPPRSTLFPYTTLFRSLALTPRLLRRGLELFAVISFFGVVVVLVFFGQDLEAFLGGRTHLHLVWLIIGLALASMDWFGGGTRLWVVARHVHPGVRWRDLVIAGGVSAWAAYLTPFQTGAGPTMMWVMRRAGVRLPEAMTSTF